MEEALDAIPEEWGNVFLDSISREVCASVGRYGVMVPVNCSTLFLKVGSLRPSKLKLREGADWAGSNEYVTRVKVLASSSVMLREGFIGSWTGLFPQYLIKAMLEGHDQPTDPEAGERPETLAEAASSTNWRLYGCSFIYQVLKPKYYLDIQMIKIIIEFLFGQS
jgi:hypothetical protein